MKAENVHAMPKNILDLSCFHLSLSYLSSLIHFEVKGDEDLYFITIDNAVFLVSK